MSSFFTYRLTFMENAILLKVLLTQILYLKSTNKPYSIVIKLTLFHTVCQVPVPKVRMKEIHKWIAPLIQKTLRAELSVPKILNFPLESPSQIAPKFNSLVEQKFKFSLKQGMVGKASMCKFACRSMQKLSKLDFTDFHNCGEQRIVSLVTSLFENPFRSDFPYLLPVATK